MALRIEDYEDGLADLGQSLRAAAGLCDEAVGHLGDANFQSTCRCLSILVAHPLEQAREGAHDLLKRLEGDGVTASAPS